MHRDVVTHVAVSATEFFITGSLDGKTTFPFKFDIPWLFSFLTCLYTLGRFIMLTYYAS